MKKMTKVKIAFMTGSREYESSINNENNLSLESISFVALTSRPLLRNSLQ